jgi:polyisoprenoid-binding protein YceI
MRKEMKEIPMSTWQTDYGHSAIEFSARHLMLSKVRGRFENFTVTVNADEDNVAGATVDVQIEAASLNSRDEKRDGHLKSPDFLDVANHPHITFKSTRLERTSTESAKLHGDLTIRGETKPVVLDVEYHGQAKTPWGTTNAGFTASTKINRQEWGLTWNVALETGGVLVGEEITIAIELELVKSVPQPEQTEAAVA